MAERTKEKKRVENERKEESGERKKRRE